MSKQKKNSRRHSRIRFPFPALNIGNIIFGALFFYMAVSLFFYLTADHIKSFQVVQGTLSRNDTYTAFAMRTESVQLSSGSGYVQFYTPNASKISRVPIWNILLSNVKCPVIEDSVIYDIG